jgi:hypothetical protein
MGLHIDPRTLLLAVLLAAPAGSGEAATSPEPNRRAGPLDAYAVRQPVLAAGQELAPLETVAGTVPPEALAVWSALRRSTTVEWRAYVDRKNGLITAAYGGGIALLPGSGNRLTLGDVAPFLGAGQSLDLDAVERIVRSYLPHVAPLLGVTGDALVLDRRRSAHPADHLWFVDFDVLNGGVPIDEARVVFRINSGNLIQFGSEQLPAPATVPAASALDREQARAVVGRHLGGFGATDTFLDAGSVHVVPVLRDRPARPGAPAVPLGQRGLARVWQLIFHRQGAAGTWRARVDAASGELLELGDLDQHAASRVSGGVVSTSGPAAPDVVRPMPFVQLSAGGYANSAGLFSSPGGAVGTDLSGNFVRISDYCGRLSQLPNADGDLFFGTSSGDDCSTPGFGGQGNTRAARSLTYEMNRGAEVARGWGLSIGQFLVEADYPAPCAAGMDIFNAGPYFGRSGDGCTNPGQIPGIAFHELGHLVRYAVVGAFGDPTGETSGDWAAALALHDSCIGSGYLQANCSGFGDGCLQCTGLRDIDFGKHASGTPATVANFTQQLCPGAPLTYFPISPPGPCGLDAYCESTVSSQALWDLVNRDLPNPGTAAAWTLVDRLWYLSQQTAAAPFSCQTSGGSFTSDGCGIGSLWETFRAIDDDDGNLANGTPHGGALFAALNRHGIACASDAEAGTTFASCAAPPAPTLTAMPGDNQVALSWTVAEPAVYDLFRNEAGCDANFARIAASVAEAGLSDGEVANGTTYYYRVSAHAAGNEACASDLSDCRAVTPASGSACSPPTAPTALRARANNAAAMVLDWKPVTGAASYHVLRGTASGGPYTEVGVTSGTRYTDASSSCGASYTYVVRSFAGCESGNSGEVVAATPACSSCTPQILYSTDFEQPGVTGWYPLFVESQWQGVQACVAHSGSHILRFGGLGCSDDYQSIQPTGPIDYVARPISLPADATSAQLSFWHRRDFPSNTGGGAVALGSPFDSDPGSPFFVPASAMISGETYNGAIDSACAPSGTQGLPVFTGTEDSFVNTVIDLNEVCRLANLAGSNVCASDSITLLFAGIVDCGATGRGWFLDDVQVTACVPPSLPPQPLGLGFYTVPPCRILDTRSFSSPLYPGEKREITVTNCGIPSGAVSLAANVTVVTPGAGGFLNLYSTDLTSPPATSVINFSPGVVRANNASLAVDPGSLTFWVENQSVGQVQLLIDVSGYFSTLQ